MMARRNGAAGLAVLLMAGLCGTMQARAAPPQPPQPPQIGLCFDDDPKNRPDLLALLDAVGRRLRIGITVMRTPWARCLLDVQQGDRDGAIGASYLPEREAIGLYPKDAQGRPDATKRISIESYALYVERASTVTWDGRHFANLTGVVATKINAASTARLKALGVPALEVNSDWAAMLEMVADHHAQAATMLTDRGDRALADNPALAARLRKLPVPLQEKPYYIMLSHQLQHSHPGFPAAFWAAIEIERDRAASR